MLIEKEVFFLNYIKSNWKIVLFPLYALFIFLAFTFMRSYTVTDADRLFLTPTFEDSNGWDIYKMENGTKKEASVQELFDSSGETFYLSRVLDKGMEQAGYTVLELDGTTWQESVFLDGELLYTVNPGLDNRIGSVEFPKEYEGLPGMGEYVRLTLPPDYAGKTLTIAAASYTAADYRGLPMVRLSSENILTQLLVSDANRISMPATAYMAAALLLLGLFFYNWYHGQKSYSNLLLTAAALIQSLRVLLNFEFYFSSHFSLNFIPVGLLIPLSLELPILYLLLQMKRWKKWYASFILVPFVLSLAAHLIPDFSFASSCDTLLYLPLLALCVFAVLEWKDKNTVFRLFTPALFAVIAAGIAAASYLILAGHGDSVFVSMLRSPTVMLYEAFQFYGGILLLLGGGVSFVQAVHKAAAIQSELSVISAKNELIQENIQSIQESSTEIAGMRHDMLRHLHTMLDLSHEGNAERLQRYLEELTKETETIPPLRVCQHPIVNALVTRALAKAKRERIQMNLHVEVPADISIPDADLCTLLMNMLDNAIEALSLLPGKKERVLELTMHVRGRYLFVETMNPCDGTTLTDKETGLFRSMKGAGHGYGMKAMSDIAKKYQSKLQIKQEDGTVIVRTALLMPDTNSSVQ